MSRFRGGGQARELRDPPELLFAFGKSGSEPGALSQPSAIAVASDRTVFVADTGNQRIQVFDAKGRFLTLFGSHGTGPGQFERPTDLDIAPDGRIYVVDFGNDRIQVFAPIEASAP